MSKTFKFQCLHCGNDIKIGQEQLGEKVDCDTCGLVVKAPQFLLSEEDKISRREEGKAVAEKLASSENRDFKCIHCFNIVDFEEELCGEKVNCPHCEKIIKLPEHVYEPPVKVAPVRKVASAGLKESAPSSGSLAKMEEDKQQLSENYVKEGDVFEDHEEEDVDHSEYDAVYSSPSSDTEKKQEFVTDEGGFEPRKIGGWLILIGIGVVVSPLRFLYILGGTYFPIFTNGIWGRITNPGSPNYIDGIGSLLIMEMVGNTLFMMAWIYMAYLFFSKRNAFRKWYAAVSILTVVFIVLDAVWASNIIAGQRAFDPDTARELGRSLAACFIWVPYLFISQRSKQTFVN